MKRGPVCRSFLAMAAATLLIAPSGDLSAAGRTAEAAPERITGGATAADMAVRQRALGAWLLQELPGAASESPARARLTPEDLRELAIRTNPPRVGAVKALGAAIGLSGMEGRGLSRAGGRHGGGFLQSTPDGGFVWAATIVGEDAAAVRVHFGRFDLPAGADAYVLSRAGEAFGPYQGRGPDGSGDFWSHTILAPEAIVMVRHYGPASAEELRGLSFTIGEVGLIQYVGISPNPPPPPGSSFCGNAQCVVNASCATQTTTGDQMVALLTDAVAYMEWVQGAWVYSCSGGLIADTDASTQIPYFLTANHCLSGNNAASSLEAFFFYRTPCGGACPDYTTFPRTLGATVVATGKSGDYSLLRLSQTPPSGSTMLGWTNTALPNGGQMYRVSHPNFAPQVFTRQQRDTSAGTCGGLPADAYIYSRDVEGATDGGSSGSPVVNASGQIIGQLYGGCGTNLSDVCDAANNATVDGAMAHYYPNVAAFLNPAGGCTPSTEVCTDGSDNDCDGLTDCADTANCSTNPACSGGGCSAKGEACTVAADCCSNKCTGPAGNKTCR